MSRGPSIRFRDENGTILRVRDIVASHYHLYQPVSILVVTVRRGRECISYSLEYGNKDDLFLDYEELVDVLGVVTKPKDCPE